MKTVTIEEKEIKMIYDKLILLQNQFIARMDIIKRAEVSMLITLLQDKCLESKITLIK
jgi:hypothetical protein